ncbi:RNase H family protein [Abeliophyllum distichum]|uniref:RNase H family protein n=1 Tax=Abeliophyllum distichum TaxID=126358 RepID=A0ABD1W3S1_9LAMI
MYSLFHACSSAILWRSSLFVMKSPICRFYAPSWKTGFQHAGTRTVNSEFLLTRFWVRRYSSKRSRAGSTKRNLDPTPVMKDDKESFFVVRKGDIVGVYKNLSDCQAQVGSSICDPPVSVYKGCSMPKDTEKYLLSCGVRNALYSIRASDLTGDLFGTLVACPFPQHTSARGEPSSETVTKKWSQEVAWSDYGQRNCTLEFDGASKGNPGQAGAGAVLRSNDGSLICRLREGLGIATNNVAEYRGIILGLKYALGKGFTGIQVRGDSNLVCMQIQGLWKVKNQNISNLYEEAKKLKDRFISFEIKHVLRDLNSEADAQANLAVDLAEGQIQEEIDK